VGAYDPAVPVPNYDVGRARSAGDWAEVPGAPDVLHDVPTKCIFCGEFVPITEADPVLVIAKPWQHPHKGWLYAAHAACLHAQGERTGTR
jgi:hypothetical protein